MALGAPTDAGYTTISSTWSAFAALKGDGSITDWSTFDCRGGKNSTRAPTDAGQRFTAIFSTDYSFAALQDDGSITAWGCIDSGGTGAPTDDGYTTIFSTGSSFAALKSDGSITAWGEGDHGGTMAGAPTPDTPISSRH